MLIRRTNIRNCGFRFVDSLSCLKRIALTYARCKFSNRNISFPAKWAYDINCNNAQLIFVGSMYVKTIHQPIRRKPFEKLGRSDSLMDAVFSFPDNLIGKSEFCLFLYCISIKTN